MNYKSQLKGWAVDRVIELWKVDQNLIEPTIENLKKQADTLAEYAFEPESDFNDAIRRVTEFLKTSPDALEKVDQLMAELTHIQEDILRQKAMREGVSGSVGGQDNLAGAIQ